MMEHVPQDLHGCSALDIGCNAGFYSFELAGRGADVTAIDTGERYLSQASWAAEKMGLERRIRFERMDVYDLPTLGRTFDLVLFLGVFYHLRYPLYAPIPRSRRALAPEWGLHARDFGSFGDASRTVVVRRSSAIGMICCESWAGSVTSGVLCFCVPGMLSSSNLLK